MNFNTEGGACKGNLRASNIIRWHFVNVFPRVHNDVSKNGMSLFHGPVSFKF